MCRGQRLDVRGQHAEGIHVVMIFVYITTRDDVDINALLLSCGIDFVVDVGDIARVDQRISRAQQPGQHVENHGRASIADVRKAVHRRAAHIHRDAVIRSGHEGFLAAG